MPIFLSIVFALLSLYAIVEQVIIVAIVAGSIALYHAYRSTDYFDQPAP